MSETNTPNVSLLPPHVWVHPHQHVTYMREWTTFTLINMSKKWDPVEHMLAPSVELADIMMYAIIQEFPLIEVRKAIVDHDKLYCMPPQVNQIYIRAFGAGPHARMLWDEALCHHRFLVHTRNLLHLSHAEDAVVTELWQEPEPWDWRGLTMVQGQEDKAEDKAV